MAAICLGLNVLKAEEPKLVSEAQACMLHTCVLQIQHRCQILIHSPAGLGLHGISTLFFVLP